MTTAGIIEDLYEGTMDPAAWSRALLGVADLVHASGAMFFAFNPATGTVLRDENHRVDPLVVTEYTRHWTFEDIRRVHFMRTPVGKTVTEQSLAIPGLMYSPIYNDFLLRVDMPHFMPTWLHKSGVKAVALSFLRTRSRGPFEPSDIAEIQPLLSHLKRALQIRDQIDASHARATNLANVLNSTRFGTLFLNEQLQILELNAAGEAILVREKWLHLPVSGPIRLANVLTANIDKKIRTQMQGLTSTDSLLHMYRKSKAPVSILIVALTHLRHLWIANRDPRYLVLIFDPERDHAMVEQLIAKDLNLTEHEARVVALLAQGISADVIAVRLKVTIHTVRSQLKSAFQKTGLHTQAELVRRVLLGTSQLSISTLSPPGPKE